MCFEVNGFILLFLFVKFKPDTITSHGNGGGLNRGEKPSQTEDGKIAYAIIPIQPTIKGTAEFYTKKESLADFLRLFEIQVLTPDHRFCYGLNTIT